jgi:thiazole synthase
MWCLAGQFLSNRLLLGTAQYPSLQIMQEAILAAQVEIITVSLRRQLTHHHKANAFWEYIKSLSCHLLPNTAGCRNASDAVLTAELARDIFNTNWIKLEVIGDETTLQPDPFELLKAADILVKKGFEVFPYTTDDLVLCQRLLEIGCKILMPWAAPIGSGKGLINPYALQTLRSRFPEVTLIIDAGIGKPSHAARAMEMGFDAVLLNSAVSLAAYPVTMARAFQAAVQAGRLAYEGGLMVEKDFATSSTPLIDTPFWHQESLS